MQQEYIGENSIEHLQAILTETKAQKVLLFCGKKSFEAYKERILDNIPCAYDLYNDFEVNPKFEQVEQALAIRPSAHYDMLIAVGGGSVMDFAKLYKYYSKAPLPLVAIPTTAGTGSEVTQFAIMYVKGEKQTVDHASIYPEYALVDAALLLGTPKYIKACTAMDAYCQALESYWAVASTEQSKAHAQMAITLAHEHIQDFVNTDALDAAKAMALASNHAGKAIQISKTTAAHALCYGLTTHHDIPHGHAVALSMIDLFAANAAIDHATCQDPRGAAYVQGIMQDILRMLGTQDFSAYWQNLAQSLGLKMSFKALQVHNKDELFSTINAQRLKNNPKELTADLKNFWLH